MIVETTFRAEGAGLRGFDLLKLLKTFNFSKSLWIPIIQLHSGPISFILGREGEEHMLEFFDFSDGLRILLAGVAGGLLGLERYLHGRPAGMRTNMLVAAASALIMLLSEKYYLLMPVLDPDIIRIDPSRIAAGAITGIGFLGAGVIIKNRASVVGLTTAATIWMVSAIGLAFGAGAYDIAVFGFALALFSLLVMDFIEKKIPQARYEALRITGKNLIAKEPQFEQMLKSSGLLIKSREYRFDKERDRHEIDYLLKFHNNGRLHTLAQKLADDPDILHISVGGSTLED